jgi:hypothetical protein
MTVQAAVQDLPSESETGGSATAEDRTIESATNAVQSSNVQRAQPSEWERFMRSVLASLSTWTV